MSYKYCIVPQCQSTTISTPDKLFFRVPQDQNARKKWCSVMKRGPLSWKSNHFCCEDHFDVENDMENYMRHRLTGAPKRIKKGVVPHKFDCQRKRNVQRPGQRKRLQPEVEHENLGIQEESEASETSDADSNDPLEEDEVENLHRNPKYKSHKELEIEQSPYKKKKIEDNMADDAPGESKHVVTEYEALGINIARKMEKLDPVQAIYAESIINTVMRRALLNQLKAESDVCEGACQFAHTGRENKKL